MHVSVGEGLDNPFLRLLRRLAPDGIQPLGPISPLLLDSVWFILVNLPTLLPPPPGVKQQQPPSAATSDSRLVLLGWFLSFFIQRLEILHVPLVWTFT